MNIILRKEEFKDENDFYKILLDLGFSFEERKTIKGIIIPMDRSKVKVVE